MLSSVFSTILDMTVTGSIVILIVLAARLLLKRMPKILSYCLWAAVLFRLLCPVSISLSVSAVPDMPSVKDNYTLTDSRVDFSDIGEITADAIQGAISGDRDPVKVPVINHTPAGNVKTEVPVDYWELAVLLGQYVWLLGIVVMLAISLASYIKLKRRMAEAVRGEDRVYFAEHIPSPFVMGLIKPKIYMPYGLSEEEKAYILLHEQRHIRRGDHLIKAISYAALCIHWFNPLVWLAFILSGRDMEMSCDEAVLKALGGDVKADYASSLLRFSVGRTTIAGAPLAFGEGDAGKRIRNLQKWKKPILWVSIVAAILCVIVIVFCVVDRNTPSDETIPPETSAPPATTLPNGSTVPPETTAPPTTQEPTLPDFPTGTDIKYVTSERIDEDTYIFTTDEFPGVTFTSSWYGRLTMEENGNEVVLLTSCPIYGICLTDLNNDGLRELVVRYLLGSGIISSEIFVLNYADMTTYKLEERSNSWDYGLEVEDDKLLIVRSSERSSKETTRGRLLLVDQQLIFDDGVNVIYGTRTDPFIDQVQLQSFYTELSSGLASVTLNMPVEYFIEKHGDKMGPLFSYGYNAYNQKYVEITGTPSTAEEDDLYTYFKGTSYILKHRIGYWYYDAENPGRLFVCSEFRDLGYKYIKDYYEDLMAGKCSAHEETFIISLDELAIYRWGSEENLYNDIVS